MKAGFLVMSAEFPWVDALANDLAELRPVTALQVYDWKGYRRAGKPRASRKDDLEREIWSLPPGYIGKLAQLLRPLLRRRLRSLRDRLLQRANDVWLICPMPFYDSVIEAVFPWRNVIYYNLDDYSLYSRCSQAQTRQAERKMIETSAWTLCLAATQVARFRRDFPHRTEAIRHFPLGVVAKGIASPTIPRKWSRFRVGYIGNLSDRVDWPLVVKVAGACPGIDFEFVGPMESEGARGGIHDEWRVSREKSLALPNVIHSEPVDQDQVFARYSGFSATWIPYDIKHRFNIASCPTKIMDGLAAGCPVVSARVPECELYSSYIDLFGDVEEAVVILKRLSTSSNGQEVTARRIDQLAFAKANTWRQRALDLVELAENR